MKVVDSFCLNDKYSTTRLVTKEKPIIEKNPDDKFETVLFLPPVEGRKEEGGLRTQGYFKTSLPDKPLITVITVVFNGVEHLEETILSVINQSYDNVEYVIIDGGSNDGTLDIIKKYEGAIDYWVSEPDLGISDAMNKGIFCSNGILLNHLNSGDSFAFDNVLIAIKESYSNEKWRWCYGFQRRVNQNGKIEQEFYPPDFKNSLLNIINFIPHQTVFIEKSLFQEVGYFSKEFKISMDYHLFLRLKSISTPLKLNMFLINFLEGGVSSQSIKNNLIEEFNARNSVFRDRSIIIIIIDWVWFKLLLLKNSLGIKNVLRLSLTKK